MMKLWFYAKTYLNNAQKKNNLVLAISVLDLDKGH